MINESEPQRRSILKFGGALAFAPLITQLTGGTPVGHALAAGTDASSALQWPTLSRKALKYRVPAADWQSQALPIGNGRLGAMLFADPDEEVRAVQRAEPVGRGQQLRQRSHGPAGRRLRHGMTGFGSYRNFGTSCSFASPAGPKVTAPGGPYSSSRVRGRRQDVRRRIAHQVVHRRARPRRCGGRSSCPTPSTVASYSLTSADDVPHRDPQEWTFSGSADGTSWTTLDTPHAGAPFESRFQTKEFAFAEQRRLPLLPVRLRARRRRQPLPGERDRSRPASTSAADVGVSVVAERALQGIRCGDRARAADSRSVDGDPTTVWRVGRAAPSGVLAARSAPRGRVTSYVLTAAPDRPRARPPQLGARGFAGRA